MWAPDNKKAAPSLGGSRPWSKLGGGFLATGLVRARFVGPLPRKGEAVRKGEIAREPFHRALWAILPVPILLPARNIQNAPEGVKGVVLINASYAVRKNYKFDSYREFGRNRGAHRGPLLPVYLGAVGTAESDCRLTGETLLYDAIDSCRRIRSDPVGATFLS